ncbi:hypothetical protein MRX96_033447 [Rhipicephalus microplus]
MNRRRLPVQKLPVPQPSTSLSSGDHSDDEDANEKFERELKWCIEQLNISLSHADAKKKNYNEELRALQTLQSVKAPVAKKRQVMSVTLGNYRAKMEQEKAKFITDSTRKTRLQPQPSAETKVCLPEESGRQEIRTANPMGQRPLMSSNSTSSLTARTLEVPALS